MIVLFSVVVGGNSNISYSSFNVGVIITVGIGLRDAD